MTLSATTLRLPGAIRPMIARTGSLAAALMVAVASITAAQAQQRSRAPVTVESCAPCHGVDGIARDVEVPHLAGQNVVYLYNQMRAFRAGTRPHKEMRYMSRHVSDADMQALAEYYANLPRQ